MDIIEFAKFKKMAGGGSTGGTGTPDDSGENKLAKLVDRSITELTAADLEGVTSIGDHAFYYCSELTSITMPDSIMKIGTYAFMGCIKLASVVIPSGVTSINTYVFYGCTALISIVMPSGVTGIASHAFYRCSGLELLDFRSATSVPTLTNQNAFSSVPSTCKVVIPDDLYDTWISATNWSAISVTWVKASEYVEE